MDGPHRLPVEDLRARCRHERVQPGQKGVRGRRGADQHADDADRVLGRGVPARPQHGRAEYSWNKVFPEATLSQLFEFSHLSGGLPGPIPSIWIADFRRLYNFGQLSPAPPALVVPPALFNRAMRIDTKLVNPLRTLPGSRPSAENNLAFRNLLRANMVKLATGQQMVTFLKSKGVTLTKLTNAQIRDGNNGANLAALNTAQRNALLTNTPLWFYILREAELNQASWRRRCPDRRGDVSPRDRGQHLLDRPRHGVPSQPRPEQHHLPHGRPARCSPSTGN